MLYRCNVYVRPRDQMTFATFANNSVILFENAENLKKFGRESNFNQERMDIYILWTQNIDLILIHKLNFPPIAFAPCARC